MTALHPTRLLRATDCPVLVLLLSLAGALLWSGQSWAQPPEPFRRALAPADRRQDWPPGDWQQVSRSELAEYELSRSLQQRLVPGPRIERLVFRGTLTSPALIEGQFEAEVVRPSGDSEFLALGDITPAVSELEWTDGPAVWGTSPGGSGRPLVYVDRETDRLSGKWALRGDSAEDGSEFDLVLFPAASIRLELDLPESYRLLPSDGEVSPSDDATDGRRRWSIELGQTTSCLCRVQPVVSQGRTATFTAERNTIYTVRPTGVRLQADFNISAPSSQPADVQFAVPPDLRNVEVTTAANDRLPVEFREAAGQSLLSVSLPHLVTGRIGNLRVSGDLDFVQGADWVLPDVRLQRSAILSSTRRVQVDHPFTVESTALLRSRQTGLLLGEKQGSWSFEDLAEDARVGVRIGRIPSAVTLRAATIIRASETETLFQTAAEFACRGVGVYQLRLHVPAGWDVTEVASRSGEGALVSAWRIAPGESTSEVEIDLRHPLTSQSPRQLIISGRRTDEQGLSPDVGLFPSLADGEQSHVLFGIPQEERVSLSPQGGVRSIPVSELADAWSPLVSLLGVDSAEHRIAWFSHSSGSGLGSVAVRSKSDGTDVSLPERRNVPTEKTVASTAPLILDLTLESDIAERGAEWHHHRAVYLLSGRTPEDPPTIRLPGDARLDRVRVDGRAQNVVLAGHAFELLDWPSSPRRVEILYRSRCSPEAGWLNRTLQIPVPQWSVAPRLLRWQVRLPRTETLQDVGLPSSTVVPRPRLSWGERLFGCLARDGETGFDDSGPVVEHSPAIAATSDQPARAGNVVMISALHPATSLEIDVTDNVNASRAGWLILLATWLVAVLLRLIHSRSVYLGCAAAGCLLVLAVLQSGAGAQLFGNALTGVLLGFLLPRHWYVGRSVRTIMGSDESVRRVAAAAGCLLFFCSLFNSSAAQESDATPRGAAGQVQPVAPPQFDVLLPLSSEPETSDVAWIRRELLPAFESWRSQRPLHPTSLLQSARYVFAADERPWLRATFNVAVFDTTTPLELSFNRLWVADPDDCRVDGQQVQVRPSANSSALLVDVSGVAGATRSPAMHVVELTLQPSAPAGRGDEWQFDVPRVLDTRISLPNAIDPSSQYMTRSHRAVGADDEGRPIFEIGQVKTVRIARGTQGASNVDRDLHVVDAVSLLEVHPLRVRVRSQLTLSSATDDSSRPAYRRKRLTLPGRADVREVALRGLRRYGVEYLGDDLTLVDLELEAASESGGAVFLDFSIPARGDDGVVTVPPLTFAREGEPFRHRIGIRAAAGVEFDPLLLSTLPPSVREAPISEAFSTGPDLSVSWPTPDHNLLSATPVSIPVALIPAPATRSAEIEQSVFVDGAEVNWHATVSINAANAPIFSHVIELSPEIQLRTVTLLRDGVAQPVDWIRDEDRVALNLAGGIVGLHQVQLAGIRSVRHDEVLPFPVFGLVDAEVTSSELIVQSAHPHQLELYGADGNVLRAGPSQSETPAGRGFPRVFAQQDAAWPVAFRCLPVAERPEIQLLTTFEREKGDWQQVTELRTHRPLLEHEALAIRVAENVAERIGFPGSGSVASRPVGDGLVQLEVSPDEASPDALTLRVALDLDTGSVWQSPDLEFLNATVVDDVTVVPDGFPYVPASAAATVVAPEEWPHAIDRQSASPREFDRLTGYRWTAESHRFTLRKSGSDITDVRLVESVLWQDAPAGIRGMTTIWLVAQQPRFEVRLPWPTGMSLDSAAWDGRSMDVRIGADEQAHVRVDELTPGSVHRLQLAWQASSRAVFVAAAELWRSRWSGSGAVELAGLFSRPGQIAVPMHRARSRSSLLEGRAAVLLELYKLESGLSESTDAGLSTIAFEIEATCSALDGADSAESAALSNEWQNLRRQDRSGREGTAETVPPHSVTPGLVASAVSDSGFVLFEIDADQGGIDVWEVRTSPAVATLVIAVFLVAVVLFRLRWTRRDAGLLKMVGSESVALFLLGAGWWLWLKFGWIGLVLMIVAVVQAWNAVRARRIGESTRH